MLFQKISFFKIPSNQKFNYDPRYYDPIREELAERESRIKSELKAEAIERERIASRLRGSFRSSFTYESQTNKNAGLLRIIIISLLTGGIWAYWEFGSQATYFLLILLPVYFFLKRAKVL